MNKLVLVLVINYWLEWKLVAHIKFINSVWANVPLQCVEAVPAVWGSQSSEQVHQLHVIFKDISVSCWNKSIFWFHLFIIHPTLAVFYFYIDLCVALASFVVTSFVKVDRGPLMKMIVSLILAVVTFSSHFNRSIHHELKMIIKPMGSSGRE